MSISKR
jgi:hypothetical protein